MKLRNLRTLLYLPAAIFLGGCTSQQDTTTKTPSSQSVEELLGFRLADQDYNGFKDRQRVITINYGGGLPPGYFVEYVLADRDAFMEDWGANPYRRNHKKLSLAEAAKIWTAIDRLRVPEWKTSYNPADISPKLWIADGTQWGVQLRTSKQTFFSAGNNVYPARDPAGAPVLANTDDGKSIPNKYADLLDIFENIPDLKLKPLPPPHREPQIDPWKLRDSKSPLGFRKSGVSIGRLKDFDVTYFLASFNVVAESPPPDKMPADHTLHYRILGSTENGDFVGGGPRSVIFIVVTNEDEDLSDPDAYMRCYRIEGTHFWKFLNVEEWKAKETDGYFLSFRLESTPTTELREYYRVKVGFSGATITKIGEEADPFVNKR